MTSNWKKAGNTKYNAGQFKAAIECYDKALEEQPTDKFLYGNRAQAHFKLNQFEEAIQDSLKSTELDPTFSKGYHRTGNAYLKIGKLEESEEQFRLSVEYGEASALTIAKEVAEFRTDWELAQGLFEQQQMKQCAQRLRKLVAGATHNIAMRRMFVQAATAAKLWDDLVAVLKNAVDDPLFRDDLSQRMSLSSAYYFTAFFEDALHHAQRVLEDDPEHREASHLQHKASEMLKLLAAGKTYMSKKAYQWSYDSFTKALDVEPGAPVIMKYLAACRAVPLMHLEKYDEAIVECNKALEGNRYNWRVKALECRAFCHEVQQHYEAAITDYEKALDLKPSAETQQRLQSLRQLPQKRKDYYEILGVAKDTDLAEIKTAYRRLALKYHPDRIQGEDEEEKAAMKSQFQEISEAYVILSDPAKRSRYDAGESIQSLNEVEQPDPFILFNVVCGVLAEDASLQQKLMYNVKQCCFWSSLCVLGTSTCPCWCPVVFCKSEHKAEPRQ